MSNTSTTPVLIDEKIIDISGEEEILPWSKGLQPYFHATNEKGLNWEGFADSKEEVESRFPGATVTEWEPTVVDGIWML